VTCAEFKENVAALALGALRYEERVACEAHLAEAGPHEGCLEELRKVNEASALLGLSLPPRAPGEHVWAAIEQEIGASGQTPGEKRPAHRTGAPSTRPGGRSGGDRGRRGREGLAWGLAAAAAAAAIAGVLAWRGEGEHRADLERRLASSENARIKAEDHLETLLARVRNVDGEREVCLDELRNARITLEEKERTLDLLGAPTTRLIQLAAQGDVPYRASALLNGDRNEAVLLSSALEPKQGKDYQLWLIRGNEKISAGLLEVAAGEPTVARIAPDLLRAGPPDAIAVTVEPEGGVPQPTGPIVLLGKVPA